MKNGNNRKLGSEHGSTAAQAAVSNAAESRETSNATSAAVEAEQRASTTSNQPATAPATGGGGDIIVAHPDLSAKERKTELKRCEKIIAGGFQGAWEAGKALIAIRDGKLYLGSHDTFEDYLRDRWGMGRSHGYRLIAASEVADILSPTGDRAQLPAHESVLRPLVGLKAEDAQAAWKSAVAKAGDGRPVTAKLVKAAAAEFTPIKPKKTTTPAAQPNGAEKANAEKPHPEDGEEEEQENDKPLDVVELKKALGLVNDIDRQVHEGVNRNTIRNLVNQLRQILMDLAEDAQG